MREFQITVNGIRSPVLEAGPADPHEAVVFVHGIPGSSRDWDGLAARWASADEPSHATCPASAELIRPEVSRKPIAPAGRPLHSGWRPALLISSASSSQSPLISRLARNMKSFASESRIPASSTAVQRFIAYWQQGLCGSVEAYLEQSPDAQQNPGQLFELILAEVELRREAGDPVGSQELLERFPHLRDILLQRLPTLHDTSKAGAHLADSTAVWEQHDSIRRSEQQVPCLGRYELRRVLGRGAVGEVWEAWDGLLNRSVALKFLRSDRSFGFDTVDLFLKEGRRLADLRHDGIVQILDAGHSDSGLYLVSELMTGGTLQSLLSSRSLTLGEAVSWTVSLARALHHAHSKGIVHRDVKPSNILFDGSGQPHLADFGFAASEEELLDETPCTLGTVAYMPPEQAGGNSHLADPRSDVYSLGVVLYQMLIGRLPFAGRNGEEYLKQIVEREPRPMRATRSEIPQQLEDICLKCLRKPMDQRFATALELAEQLELWQQSAAERNARGPALTAVTLSLAVGLCGLSALVATSTSWRSQELSPNRALPATLPAIEKPSVLQQSRPIAWHPRDEHDKYEYVRSADRFDFDAFGEALFEAGTNSGKSIHLKTIASMRAWQGTVGVFWGLTPASDASYRCWSVSVGRFKGDQPFNVYINEYKLGPSNGWQKVRWAREWKRLPVDPPIGDRISLELIASENAVEKVLVNGSPVLDDPFAFPDASWMTANSGFGFCGHAGNVSVYSISAE